jgi:1-acyl-sn-glycerol-3-phosphate acyltransferase
VPARYSGRASDRLVLREMTDDLMYAIRELSGQEYVDTYATKKPDEGIPAEPAVIGTSPAAAS